MTQSPPFPLLRHPAFQGLSPEGAQKLQHSSRLLRFELGQQMAAPESIPANLLILLQGQARLVSRHHGRLTTVGKFGPGSVIGAASLLCGQPCENVVASQETTACAIADEVWAELYASEASFRSWCDRQIWPQELLQLIEALRQNSPDSTSSRCNCWSKASRPQSTVHRSRRRSQRS